jgi:hypothetical protein
VVFPIRISKEVFMIENDGKGKLEEKRVTDLVRERGERFHRRGRKPKSPESQRLPKNALRLLRHILKVTSKENPIWSESVEEVAKGLGIDPSTVKRLRRRFCEVGVWGRKKDRAAGGSLHNTRWIWRRPKRYSGKESGERRKRVAKKRRKNQGRNQNQRRKFPHLNPLLLLLWPYPSRPNCPLRWWSPSPTLPLFCLRKASTAS